MAEAQPLREYTRKQAQVNMTFFDPSRPLWFSLGSFLEEFGHWSTKEKAEAGQWLSNFRFLRLSPMDSQLSLWTFTQSRD